MMSDAPLSFAPSVAHRPIGPWREHGDGVTDLDVAAFGAGQTGREDVRAQQHGFVGEIAGIGARLARASGTSRYSAQAPLMVLPNRQPPSAPPHCECAPFRQ